MTVVDPNRGLVYLLAGKCVALDSTTTRTVGTTVVINLADGTFTAIDEEPVRTGSMGHHSAVYSVSAAAVYVYSSGGATGRIIRIEGKAATKQTPTTGTSSVTSNPAHKLTVLKNSNRPFFSQFQATSGGVTTAPGGLGVVDGTTMLMQAPVAAPTQFGSLAVNDTTAKLYVLEPGTSQVVLFGTGSD